MKPLIAILLLVLAGCSTPKSERLFAERIVDKVTAGNETFWVEIQTKHLDFKLGRANPTIGFSASASRAGITHNSQTNLALSVAYHSVVPAPSMPQAQTNSTQKPK